MSRPLRMWLCFVMLTTVLPSFSLYAQTFTGIPRPIVTASLQAAMTTWEVYQIDVAAFDAAVKSNQSASPVLVNLNLGPHNWRLNLSPSEVIGSNYSLQIKSPQGIETYAGIEQIAFKGQDLNNYGHVRLTIDNDFLYGFVNEGEKRFYIEPLWYYEPTAPHDLFVVYDQDKVVRDNGATCAVVEAEEELQNLIDDPHNHDKGNQAEMMGCYQLELAIASDRSMFDKYGSIGAVQAHNIGVINDVQGDYTGNFNHDIQFLIVTQFIVTGSDPWTNSLDAGTLLASFRNWGNGGNFGVPFDLGELWTNRDFTGGTVGIAYLSSVCSSNKYHCLQDFTSNSELLRCMTSHEIGHNFSCTHDPTTGSCPPNYIMCPFVSTSTEWSSQSVSQFNAFVQPLTTNGCLSPCAPPYNVDFSWSPNPACQGQPVHFTDETTGGTVTTWAWTFAGGTPATSTQQNPNVTWNAAGTFAVKLTVSGPGGSSSLTQQVTITPLPFANFTYSVSGTTVTFTNTSLFATDYVWDFGDGNGSFEQDPIHTYDPGGVYTVVLTASNSCGTSTKTVTINTAPTADFSADPTEGCAPLIVQFSNESTPNAVNFVWQFPGGTPSASNLSNPVVTYSNSGTYSVTLTAYNNVGSSTMVKNNYITVKSLPSSNFTFTVNGLTTTFTNTSANATSFLWNFGDGTTSTETNPVHTYSTGGVYTVTLTSTNSCGSVTSTKTVTLLSPPTAAFTANPTSGCAPLTVQFTNQSTGATSYNWSFPGGIPATSTDANPLVLFSNPGNYTVTLTAVNAAGSSTATSAISVIPEPLAGFADTTSGLTVHFTNTTTNGTSYTWNFGDDSTSTNVNPVHVYAQDGTYPVRLIATGLCGVDTIIKNVTVVTPPTAGFSADPATGCAPLTVQFTSTSSANSVTYNWSFPGGTPDVSNVQNPVVVYNEPGVYPVSLIVSNTAGSDTLETAAYVLVTTVPAPAFTSSTNGNTASFSNTTTNATSYSWDFGDGTGSTDVNPAHTYAQDGTYTVVLTAANDCGTNTYTQVITTSSAPTAAFTANNTSGCAPLAVQFTNNSSANATTYNWQFPGGTPSSSTEQNPLVTYNVPGVYSVTLTAGNAAGAGTSVQTDYITVGTVPAANFSASVSGSTASFSNSSTNALNYSWDFGDGSGSLEANPNHGYLNDGTYTVVLTAVNACGSTTYTQDVVVITAANAGFTANSTTGCASFTVQFDDLSSGNTISWAWTFPGGNPSTSTEQNPTVIYDVPGVYDVTLVATSAGGSGTFTQTGFIHVLGGPTAGYLPTVNGAVASFGNTSNNATGYVWDFGDGSNSTESDPTHTYLADGVYEPVLTAVNNCGTSTYSETVTIVTPPQAAFATPGGNTGCAPFMVDFDNQSSANATSFEWTFENGTPATSTDENPVVVWTQPGVYNVTLIVANAAGSSAVNGTVTVNTTPAANFAVTLAGLTISTANNSTNATSYAWSFGDGSTSTETAPIHEYLTPGTYNVVLRATNECGTTETAQDIDVFGAPPTAAFSSGESNGCVPFTVSFTDQSLGNPTSWAWSFPGGNPSGSTLQNPTVTYSAPGVYNVELTATNAFGSNTVFIPNYIVAQGLPAAAFLFVTNQGTVSFSNSSFNATNYNWNFGDGTTSTEANPTHTYLSSGTYTVELTALNPCGASTLQQVVTVTITGTETPEWLNRFQLYPNPNNGVFTVEMEGEVAETVEFDLYNTLGELVKHEKVDFGAAALKHILRYGDLPAALYNLRVRSGEHALEVKVVIER